MAARSNLHMVNLKTMLLKIPSYIIPDILHLNRQAFLKCLKKGFSLILGLIENDIQFQINILASISKQNF